MGSKRVLIENYITYTYRNIGNIRNFFVTHNEIFVVCTNKICKVKKRNQSKSEFPLTFDVISGFLHKNNLYLSTNTSTYIFDQRFKYLRKNDYFTVNFTYNNYIFTYTNNFIYMYDSVTTESLKLKIIHDNGICSGIINSNSFIYLFFENGKIYKIDNFIETIQKSEFIELTDLVTDIKEPILSVSGDRESIIFSGFESNKIYLYNKNKISREIGVPIICILVYDELILGFGIDRVYFMNKNLEIIGFSFFMFDIHKASLFDRELFISFDNGLLISYDITNIYEDINK